MAHYSLSGFCPCCDHLVSFQSENDWYRDNLLCPRCASVVRERALALVLEEIAPQWRRLQIHESSPANRGISQKLKVGADRYVASHFFKDQPLGCNVDGFRNENLEKQTFGDGAFDIVITLDVMEHVFHPERVYQEIFRTLKPDGYYLHTFPVRKWQVEPVVRRALLEPSGDVKHLVTEPEYHGNPIDGAGSLVIFDYGYDIGRQIAEWAPFDVRVVRFWDQTHGIIGEYTEVFVCRKRER